jgi:tRNA G26 N,N-dimethylase Trm1
MLFRKAALIRLSFIRNAHPLTQDFPRTFVSKIFPTTRRMSSSSNSNNNGSSSYVSTAAASSSLDAPPPQEGYLRVREGSVYMDYDEKEAVFYNKVQEFNRDISCQVIRLFAEQREKEKEDKFQKRINAWNVVCAKQEALAARESGKDYDKSIDLNKVTPLVKGFTDPKSNTFGVPVECYTDPSKPNGKDIRKPFQEPKGIHILDALAATGLRSVRYLKEIPNVRKVTVNDIIPEAAPAQRENCAKNGVEFFDAGAGAGAESSADISTNTTSAIGKASISTADAVQFMYANKSSTVGLEAFDVIDLDP